MKLPDIHTKMIKKTTIVLIVTALIILFGLFGSVTLLGQSKVNYEQQVLSVSKSSLITVQAETLDRLAKGKVIRIIDGDTIEVQQTNGINITVRLIGIDTPEIEHNGRGVADYFGEEATKFTEWLLLNKTVYLEQDVTPLDRYQRTLAYVYLESGTQVNYLIIRLGYAQILTIPPNVKYSEKYLEAQKIARDQSLGLWK